MENFPANYIMPCFLYYVMHASYIMSWYFKELMNLVRWFTTVCIATCGLMVLKKLWNFLTTRLMNILVNQLRPFHPEKYSSTTSKVSLLPVSRLLVIVVPKRRARVLIPPGYLPPRKGKQAKYKVHQWSRAWVTVCGSVGPSSLIS